MELENLHKHMHLNNLANGTVEVLFAGQPALTISKNSMAVTSGAPNADTFYWTVNPVFARLTYGANVFSDIPQDYKGETSVELAVAAGMEKLDELGVFKTMVDLPEDSYAATMTPKYAESEVSHSNELHAYALNAMNQNVMEAVSYLRKLKTRKLSPKGDAKSLCEKFQSGVELSALETMQLNEHILMGTREVYREDGLPVTSKIVIEKVTEEAPKEAVQTTIDESTAVDESTLFEKFKARKVRISEERENKKLIKTITHKARAVKVYRCPDTNEYKAELHDDGKHHEPADYYTDDKADVHATAEHMLKFRNEAADRSEFNANTYLDAAKKGSPVTVSPRKVRIINAKTGATVSKHDSETQAKTEFTNKKYSTKTHSIQEEADDGTFTDLTTLVIESEEAYEKWHSEVQAKHGDKGIKIKGRVEKGVHTSSAEVPGQDRSYAVFDHATDTGHIFEESEDVIGEEYLGERELSDTEAEKREEIVLALKKNKGFVSKFGKDAIWAVATAQAKTAGG